MKSFFKLRNLFIIGSICFFIGLILYLFFEAFFNGHFRTTQDKIWSTQQVDLTGLRDLKASGGTSVRFSYLTRRLNHVKETIVIIDGISELHGYVYGIPTTFFAYQNPHPHWKYYIRRWIFTGTADVRPDLIISESEVAQKNGFSYFHVQVGSKFISSSESIDEIVKIFDTLPKNSWVHFHCHYGKGRTSMMLVMFDIMRNAPHVSLTAIVNRQHLLGSEDLLNIAAWKKGSYTKQQLEERAAFIKAFYAFVSQRKAGGIQRWTDWLHTTIPQSSTEVLQDE